MGSLNLIDSLLLSMPRVSYLQRTLIRENHNGAFWEPLILVHLVVRALSLLCILIKKRRGKKQCCFVVRLFTHITHIHVDAFKRFSASISMQCCRSKLTFSGFNSILPTLLSYVSECHALEWSFFFFQITFLYWVKKRFLRFYVRTTNQSVFVCAAADSGDIS